MTGQQATARQPDAGRWKSSRGDRCNRFERLRDPSHTRALTVDDLRNLLNAVGRPVRYWSEGEVDVELNPWLDLTHTPSSTAKRIAAALHRELARGESTGMRPRDRGGRLSFL